MNHTLLDSHSLSCNDNNFMGVHTERSICELNPRNLLFYLYGKFHLVTYYKCAYHTSEQDFCKWIIGIICEKSCVTPKSINKSIELNSRFKEAVNLGLSAKHTVTEINYTYSNAAGKEWSVVTRLPFCESLINEENLYTEYIEAKNYILENLGDCKYYMNDLQELYQKNNGYRKHKSISVVNTIDLLIKQINKK